MGARRQSRAEEACLRWRRTGVFDAANKCLLGIMARKIVVQTDPKSEPRCQVFRTGGNHHRLHTQPVSLLRKIKARRGKVTKFNGRQIWPFVPTNHFSPATSCQISSFLNALRGQPDSSDVKIWLMGNDGRAAR